MAEIHGAFDERFADVAEALERSLERGADLGASVAVTLHGEPVVDIWGGHLDEERTRPWERDTIVNVFSTTKTMTTLCALMLADRGELDLHAPVARYWPEFAEQGKARVTVAQVLGHTAGLAGWTESMTVRDLADWERCTTALAAQAPWWEPGTASGYHALTQGYLVGELVRRITGQPIRDFFDEQVAQPLGADFHIGLPEAARSRAAPLIGTDPDEEDEIPLGRFGTRALRNPRISGELSAERWWQRAEIPAANGHGNARSVAAVQSVIACGGSVAGTRLLSAAGLEPIFAQQSQGRDLVLGLPVRFGMGFALASMSMPAGPRCCSWGGYGGSVVFNDLDAGVTVAYVMNRMRAGVMGDGRGAGYILATALAVAAP